MLDRLRPMRPHAIGLSLFLAALAGVAVAGSGGPDDGGLVFVDSEESAGPPHHVLALGEAAEDLGLDDESTVSVVLPFELDWYGISESTVVVGDNGTLFFEGGQGASDATCAPGGVWSGVAVYWDDLQVETVSVEVMGRYPYRAAVFDWEGMHPHGVVGEGHGCWRAQARSWWCWTTWISMMCGTTMARAH